MHLTSQIVLFKILYYFCNYLIFVSIFNTLFLYNFFKKRQKRCLWVNPNDPCYHMHIHPPILPPFKRNEGFYTNPTSNKLNDLVFTELRSSCSHHIRHRYLSCLLVFKSTILHNLCKNNRKLTHAFSQAQTHTQKLTV